jgi:hypothetical protein
MSLEEDLPAGLTDISSHADNTPSETHHSTLATRAASTGPKFVPRINSPPNDIVNGLADHECLWHTGFDVEYSASFAKQMGKNRILTIVFAEPSDVSHMRFVTLYKISGVLVPSWAVPTFILN